MNAEEVIKKLKANKDNIVINDVIVQNVEVNKKEKYSQISLNLNKELSRLVHVTDNDGVDTLENVPSSLMFTSEYPISALLKATEGASFLGSHVVAHPKACKVLLDHAKVTIIQELVPANMEYINPFTTQEDAESVVFNEDKYINHIIDIKLSKVADKFVDKIADQLLFGDDED